ncbi:MAG: PQQ-dependent sugar dehydrogenase [Maribacter arcticus]|uniref:PQQ-dependent sugar dehydrogenase n=1 Tax=Maribacter arcticus TaxID=561365 RepID=UPI00300332B1
MKNSLQKFIGILVLLFFVEVNSQISYQDAFSNLTFNFPVEIQGSIDNTNRIFVIEQTGLIKVFPNKSNVTVAEQSTFLDISSTVAYSAGQEIGLLGLAFHPSYSSNGYIYVYYIDQPSNYRINIARYQVDNNNPNLINTSTRTIIAQFTKNQSDSNHNGGKIAFGPDGYLYVSIGDGGGGGDPQGNGQNLNTVFGSLLRIDIDIDGNNPIENNPELPNGNYEIPSDNPRVGQSGLDELYAWGIRNTWKFSFDTIGNLWGSDVGQNVYEEINIISKGGNYGWNRFEANSQPSYGSGTALATNPDIKPIFNYNHNAGDVSITGGYVYRGSLTNSILQNRYIYGDYVSGRVWALNYNSANGSTSNELLFKTNGQFISSFGVDEAGELYFSDYGTNVKLYKLTETITGPITTLINGIGEWKAISTGTNGIVETISELDTNNKYVGGIFSTAGNQNVSNLALLNSDNEWQSFESGVNGPIYSTAIAPDGSLYVAGDFTAIGGVNANNIARWDGTIWSSLSSGTNGPILKINFDASGALYVGGVYTTAGGIAVNNISKWQNNTWEALFDNSTGIAGTNNEIRSIAFDENNNMYVGGNFDSAGGISAFRIARWDGLNWSSLGAGTSGFVQAIEPVGNYLYVGGNFAIAGNQTVNRIARYDMNNLTWETLGTGLSGNVNAITTDGTYIYVGGTFDTASDNGSINKIVNNLARWSSSQGWQALGTNTNVGINTRVNSLAFTKNKTELIVGGNFTTAGNINTNNIAIWGSVFCTEDSIIPEYEINGIWESGSTSITIQEGGNLTLSILPNTTSFTITLPGGTSVNGDYLIENTNATQSGTYIFTTAQGCTENFTLVIEPNSQADDDNDGVINSLDLCPNTPIGETVDTNGCSSSQLDDDNDGVPNNIDQCPNTLNGVVVDNTGCVITSTQDEDNDGITNSEDQCPNTPVGETVTSTGCSTLQLDSDNDGVNDELDLCPNTADGESVNSVGCSATYSFSSNQFKITTTGTTCIDVSNGSILVESISSDNFLATLIGPNTNNSLPFSEILNIDELENGEYYLCIASIEFPEYQNCSKIIINEPSPLDVQFNFDSLTNIVTLKMHGAKEYTVEINGKSMRTQSNELILQLYDEINNVSVVSDQLCQGEFEETIILENAFLIYPNPVNESLSIDLKSITSEYVEIAIFTESGLLMQTNTYQVGQRIIEINTSGLTTGIYFLRLKNDKINKSFKLIKQ